MSSENDDIGLRGFGQEPWYRFEGESDLPPAKRPAYAHVTVSGIVHQATILNENREPLGTIRAGPDEFYGRLTAYAEKHGFSLVPLEKAQQLESIIQRMLRPTELMFTDFTPVMGAHAGPGVIGLAYYFET